MPIMFNAERMIVTGSTIVNIFDLGIPSYGVKSGYVEIVIKLLDNIKVRIDSKREEGM